MMPSHNDVVVKHEPEKKRFVMSFPGRGIASVEYMLTNDGNKIDLQHTYTSPTLRGKGLAAKVVRAAFEYAADNKLKVIPTCTYIPVFCHKNPEFVPLLDVSENCADQPKSD